MMPWQGCQHADGPAGPKLEALKERATGSGSGHHRKGLRPQAGAVSPVGGSVAPALGQPCTVLSEGP